MIIPFYGIWARSRQVIEYEEYTRVYPDFGELYSVANYAPGYFGNLSVWTPGDYFRGFEVLEDAEGNTIILAGFSDTSTNPCGFMYRSTDYGMTFQKVPTVVASRDEEISVIRDMGDGVVLAGTGDAFGWIIKSVDYGLTWTQTDVSAVNIIEPYDILKLSNGTVLATGGASYANVIKSIDNGDTWTTALADQTQYNSLTHLLDFQDGRVWVGVNDNTTPSILESTDYGDNWSVLYNFGVDGANGAVWSLVHLGGGEVLISTGSQNTGSTNEIYRTTDYGVTWAEYTKPTTESSVNGFAYDSNKNVLYATVNDTGSGGGLYRSDDKGATWEKKVQNPGNVFYHWYPKLIPDTGQVMCGTLGGFINNVDYSDNDFYMQFNSINSITEYAAIAESTDFQVDTFTMNFWFICDAGTTRRLVVRDGTQNAEEIFQLYWNGSSVEASLDFDARDSVGTSITIDTLNELTINQLYMYTITFSPTEAKVYVNGRLHNTLALANPIRSTATTDFILYNNLTKNGAFDGSMSDFMWISNQVLDQAEITALYNEGVIPTYESLGTAYTDNCKCYLTLSSFDDSGTDRSGSGNNLSEINGLDPSYSKLVKVLPIGTPTDNTMMMSMIDTDLDNSYIDIGGSADFAYTTAESWGFGIWFRTTGTGGNRRIFVLDGQTAADTNNLQVYLDGNILRMYNTSEFSSSAGKLVNNGDLHHLAVACDGQNITMMIDGDMTVIYRASIIDGTQLNGGLPRPRLGNDSTGVTAFNGGLSHFAFGAGLTLDDLHLLYNNGAPPTYASISAGIKSKLVCYLTMTGEDDSLTDLTGNGNNGTASNCYAEYPYIPKETATTVASVGAAMTLSQGMIDCGTADDSAGDFAMSASCRIVILNANVADAALMSNAINTAGWMFYTTSAQISFRINSSANDVTISENVVDKIGQGKWAQFTATYDGANIKLYVNGILVGTDAYTGAINASGTSYKLGGRSTNLEELNIAGCEWRIWDTALTQSEVTELYNDGNFLAYGDMPASLLTGLVSAWDTYSGDTTLLDLHGANNGTYIDSGGTGKAAKFEGPWVPNNNTP